MAATAIFAVACTTGALFLLRFLVAICGAGGRGSQVVHVLREWPERDGGNDMESEIADEDANNVETYRGMSPAAKLTSRRHRGAKRERTCRTGVARKSIR